MKITEILNQRTDHGDADLPLFGLEFFPPKTKEGERNLINRIHRLKSLGPSFSSITWGAGGSSSGRSLELADLSQNGQGLPTILHITATNTTRAELREHLTWAYEHGIRNLLVLRGDRVRRGELGYSERGAGLIDGAEEEEVFEFAYQLVKFIRSEFQDKFCIGVSGYPDNHPETQPIGHDLIYLKQKIQYGADFIMTQFFLDPDHYVGWVKELRHHDITLPVIPEIMIIQSRSSFDRLVKLTQIPVPDQVRRRLDEMGNDDDQVRKFGVELAATIIRKIHHELGRQVPAVHLVTLNLEQSVKQVVDTVGWLKGPILPPSSQRTEVITLAATAEQEFPNGRFGPTASPAYGDLIGYGTETNVLTQATSPKPTRHLPRPTDLVQLGELIASFLHRDIPQLPWSDEAWNPELELLLPKLLKLNLRGIFTLTSQPNLDGISATHPIHGWGPQNELGWVYQKEFVELLITKQQLSQLVKEQSAAPFVLSVVGIDSQLRFHPLDRPQHLPAPVTLTWGIFPNREVIQPTTIEYESFKLWGHDFFGRLSHWAAALSSAGASEASQFIDQVKHDYLIVNLIDHDYRHENHGRLLDWIDSVL